MLIDNHWVRNLTHVAMTEDVHIAEATTAIKNPGQGQYHLVIIGPRSGLTPRPHKVCPLAGYTIRGHLRPQPNGSFKITVQSAVHDDPAVHNFAHKAEIFVRDLATAHRLLNVLAKEMVYDERNA